MCEPYHSVVQYPDQDDNGDPTGPKIDAIPGTLKKWAKKIASWFHFSKMGVGHSEAIAATPAARLVLPPDTKYETAWWNRETKIDGPFYGALFDKAEALESATVYSQAVSTGSLHALRQFLETSIQKSERPYLYMVQCMEKLFNDKGREAIYEKIKRCGLPKLSGWTYESHQAMAQQKEALSKVILGATRKRELLVPEWADDKKLWVPGT